MGCRAAALLLLTLAIAVALPSSLVAAGGRGASTGPLSIQGTDAVSIPFPAQDQEQDPTGTKSITSKLMSAGAPSSRKNSFNPEAYPVKWNHERSHIPPILPRDGGGSATQQSTFTLEAYPVKWNHKRGHIPPISSRDGGGVAAFTPEAYPVKWNHKRYPSPPPLSDVAAQRSSFTPAEWSPKRDPSPSLDDVAAHQSSFMSEACTYPKKRSTKRDPNPTHAYVAETTLAHGHDDLHVQTGMMFTRNSMFPGAILPEGTKFAGNGFPDPRRFVFRKDADAIPFSYTQVDTILRTFRIPRGSKKADQVTATLRTCEAESSEPHTCATSKQAEVEFAASMLATRTSELRAIVTVVHGEKDDARYAVAPNGVARIGKAGGTMVPCHLMAYPYLVHYCHKSADVDALRVELMGLGDKHDAAAASGAAAIAMCHANTTSWDARYFQMLNATRGEEICHFMPRNYVLWLPAAAL